MQEWPEHSLYGYFKRLSTCKLKRILEEQNMPSNNSILTAEDYKFIRQILQTRPDSGKHGPKQL